MEVNAERAKEGNTIVRTSDGDLPVLQFWVSTRAIECGGGFHLLRVLLIGAHHFAVTSIVGVVKPMDGASSRTGVACRKS
jgi:hypothetical protein